MTKMKLPGEDRSMLVPAFGLMTVALVLTGRWIIGVDPSHGAESGRVATTAVSHSEPVRRHSGAEKKVDGFRSLDLELRMTDLLAAEAAQYEGSGRDIFQVQVERPQVKTPPEREERRPDPPKAPSLPPIPLRFFGCTWRHGARWIFLSKNDDVFIASEGDIVDRRYRIVRIAPSSVEVEDMLNSHRETILMADSSNSAPVP